jgi:hypothetical protein
LRPLVCSLLALTAGFTLPLPHPAGAQGTDPIVGTYVGTSFVGPVTIEITLEGDSYRVTDRSSSYLMSAAATRDDAGVLQGEYVAKLLGFTRRHKFALTPITGGFQYRTTGQNTPLERYSLLDGTAESQFWFDAIGGRQLASFDRYSSGGSTYGGYTREKRATLCTDGTFTYRAQSSTSISGDGISASSSSSDGGEGRWRLITRGGTTSIEVRFTDGRIEQLQLTRRGDEMFVDGEKYLRGDRVC